MTDRQLISSGSPYEPIIGFSRAVRVGNQVFVSGTGPVWPDGHIDPSPLAQARRVWEIALSALAQAGGNPEHVVRTRQFLASKDVVDEVSQAHGEIFGAIRPASTMMIAQLLDERWVVEVELDAVLD
jgi:enamine deaminase RidA (YjgF/YER057c/UK114 family)